MAVLESDVSTNDMRRGSQAFSGRCHKIDPDGFTGLDVDTDDATCLEVFARTTSHCNSFWNPDLEIRPA
jgi:hypothetical protein